MRLVVLSQEASGLFAMLQFLIRLDLLKPESQELINYLMVYANIKFLLKRPDFIRRMNPINSLKKLLLNILVPYIEGSNKKKVRIKINYFF